MRSATAPVELDFDGHAKSFEPCAGRSVTFYDGIDRAVRLDQEAFVHSGEIRGRIIFASGWLRYQAHETGQLGSRSKPLVSLLILAQPVHGYTRGRDRGTQMR